MQPDPPAPSGLLSNVFNFVAHEFHSFVTTAAGGEPPQRNPRASSSRLRLDNKPYGSSKSSSERALGAAAREKRRQAEGTRRRTNHARTQRTTDGEEADDESRLMPPPPVPLSRQKGSTESAFSGDAAAERKQAGGEDIGASDRTSRSPSPSVRTKKQSVTMPGSLFPRSPSMEPEFASLTDNERRVRFEAGVPSSLKNSQNFDDDAVHDAEVTPSQRIRPRIPPDTPSPVRISGGPSVKGAAGRFADDADHALMLPNSTTSPNPRSAVARSDVPSREEPESPRIPAKDKGKGRASDWDFDFADAETSGEVRVRGMERELYEAREERRRRDLEEEYDMNQSILMEERDRDRERIRTLEEEVARLRSELAARRAPTSNGNIATNTATSVSTYRTDAPPPPPPPPPPPSGAAFPIPLTVASIRNRTGGTSATDSFLVSARASLKPTAQPVEAPINSMTRTRRARQPTVNVPSDKMAAFLDEMKHAKLRRTESSLIPSSDPTARSSGPRRHADVGNITISAESSRDILLELARSRTMTRTGPQKRKRNDDDDDDTDIQELPAKRRFIGAPSSISESSQSSVTSTASATTSFDSGQSTSRDFFNRSWPSTSTIETDVTTPSLCSDNENDGDMSPTNPLPPTPPTRRGRTRAEEPPRTQTPEGDEDDEGQHHEQKDRDDLPSGGSRSPTPQLHIEQPQPVVASSRVREIDLLAMRRRIPSSPMPSSTPRKPLPPARTRVVSKSQVTPEPPEYDSSDEDDLDRPPSPPQPRPKVPPQPVVPPPSRIPRKADKKPAPSQPSSLKARDIDSASTAQAVVPQQASTSNHVKRRRTLDEELRHAGDHLWTEADDDDDDDLESGLLVGVGSKSTRKGFLSGGGAAGIPVFMGPGYVDGAEDESPSRERSRSSSRNRR